MTTPTLPDPGPQKKEKSKYLGCVIAAAIVGAIAFAGIIVAVFVMFRPAKTVPNTQVITGGDTLAVIHLNLDLDDPEFSAMVDDGIDRYVKASQIPKGSLPPSMQWTAMFQNTNSKQAKKQFRTLVPGQVTVAWEPNTNGDPHIVAIGNADHIPRMQLKMYTVMFSFFGEKKTHKTSKREYKIMNDDMTASGGGAASFFVVLHGNSIIYSNDLDAMTQALDRIDGDAPAEAVAAQALLDEISGSGQAFGVLQLDPTTQSALLPAPTSTPSGSSTASPTPTPVVREMALAAGVCETMGVRAEATSVNTAEAQIIVQCADAQTAKKALKKMPKALTGFEQEMTSAQLQFTRSEKVDGSRVIVTYDVTNIDDMMDYALGKMFNYSGMMTPAPSPPPTAVP